MFKGIHISFHLKNYTNPFGFKEKLQLKMIRLHIYKQGYLRHLEGSF